MGFFFLPVFSVDEHLFVFITTEHHQIHLRVRLPDSSLFLDNMGKQKKQKQNKGIFWEAFTEIFSMGVKCGQFAVGAPNSGKVFHMFCGNVEGVRWISGYSSYLVHIIQCALSKEKMSANPSLFKLWVYRMQITEQPQ